MNKFKFLINLFFVYCFLFFSNNSYAEVKTINDTNLRIEYDSSNQRLADKIQSMVKPSLNIIKDKLKLSFDKDIFLKICKNKADFQQITGIKNLSVQGVAIPEYNLIVISAENIFYKSSDDIQHLLEHEIAHLVLADNIGLKSDNHFPRWFNEGLAQWLSEGSNELFSASYQDSLQTAFITGRLIPFSELVFYFPGNQSDFTQAYAQSLSFIEYLIKKYDNDRMINLVNNLKGKDNFYTSFYKIYGVSFGDSERDWIKTKKTENYTLDYYVSTHITSLINGLIGIIAIFVFVVLYFRKKNIKLNEEEDYEKI